MEQRLGTGVGDMRIQLKNPLLYQNRLLEGHQVFAFLGGRFSVVHMASRHCLRGAR